MKLLYIALFKHTGDDYPLLLCSAANLSQFGMFHRSNVKEILRGSSRTIVARTPSGARQTCSYSDFNVNLHAYVRADSLGAILVTDEEYPRLSAFTVLKDAMANLEKADAKWSGAAKDNQAEPEWLAKMLSAYADPSKFDKITQVQKKLDEVKDLMNQNIEAILKNGETLDSLIQKSQDLSDQSKQFHKKAKKLKPCCRI